MSCDGGVNEKDLLFSFDFNTNTETTLGSHDEAVRCVVYSEELGMICLSFSHCL